MIVTNSNLYHRPLRLRFVAFRYGWQLASSTLSPCSAQYNTTATPAQGDNMFAHNETPVLSTRARAQVVAHAQERNSPLWHWVEWVDITRRVWPGLRVVFAMAICAVFSPFCCCTVRSMADSWVAIPQRFPSWHEAPDLSWASLGILSVSVSVSLQPYYVSIDVTASIWVPFNKFQI